MFKNKLVIVAVVGMLAMCLGLVACGGNNASSKSAASSSSASSSASASSSTKASSTSSSSTIASTDVVYWTGTLSDGSSVAYMDDAATEQGALAVIDKAGKKGVAWAGPYTVTGDGMVTITDSQTKQNISFTITDVTPKTSMKIDVKDYGEVSLTAVTAGEFTAYVEGFASGIDAAQSYLKQVKKYEKKVYRQMKRLAKALESYGDNDAVFWSGTLPSGEYVCYLDDAKNSKAAIAVIKKDYSDGIAAYGTYTKAQDGKITLTDKSTGATVSYTATETTPGSAMELNVDGYGTVSLQAVTKADIVKFAEDVDKYLTEAAAK